MSRGDKQLGDPIPEMEPVENASAEALLSSLKTIDPAERRKHASVFNYWLSIRGPRQFPPIRDLDPLEISDAGPWSILLEMIGGGEDAVVRHLGQEIGGGLQVEKIGDAPIPSLLACIHAKLPLVAACREAFAFEESYEGEDGPRRCWLTLLPFSENGTRIDYVYGYVSLEGVTDGGEEAVEEAPEVVEDEAEVADVVEPAADESAEEEPEVAEIADEPVEEAAPEPFQVELKPYDEEPEAAEAPGPVVDMVPEPEPVTEFEPEPELVEELPEVAFEDPPEPEAEAEPEAAHEAEPEPELEPDADSRPSFTSKFMESLASVGGFYGKVAQSGPELPAEAFVEDTNPEPASPVEGSLQSKLSNVRALAEEAREAQVRSNMALYEGLGAAYDFALDAEEAPEEYLRLVEAQGLKIQLRSPMKPVVKLAFNGMCDEPTIAQLEAVLAWALKHDLPRGTLAERIEAEGGIGQILNGKAD